MHEARRVVNNLDSDIATFAPLSFFPGGRFVTPLHPGCDNPVSSKLVVLQC